MTKEQAEALAAFLNRCNERYRAETLPVGEAENWVILTDRTSGANPPPIVDLSAYLRAMQKQIRLSPDCLKLLGQWHDEYLVGEDRAEAELLGVLGSPIRRMGRGSDSAA